MYIYIYIYILSTCNWPPSTVSKVDKPNFFFELLSWNFCSVENTSSLPLISEEADGKRMNATGKHSRCTVAISGSNLPVHSARSQFLETSTMPDIAKSDISPNLDRDKMFNELWWLNYCFCEGVGIGAVGNPFCGGEAVNICLHSRCEMTDVGDPFCSNIRVCLCITDQCSLPPAEGSPICVCFNKKLAGGDGWSGQQLFDWSTSFGDTFWLYYIFCMGLGFSAPQANGRPLFAVQVKELCIKGGTKLTTPMEGGKLCSMVSTLLGAVCSATSSSRGGSYVRVLQPSQQERGLSKAACIWIWDPCVHLNATNIFWMPGLTSVPAWQHHNFEDDVAGLPWTCNLPVSCRSKGTEAMQHTCIAAAIFSLWLSPLPRTAGTKGIKNINNFMQNQNIGSRPQCVLDVLGLLDMALRQ